MTELTTDRLLLHPWKKSDSEPYADLNQDPAVVEHFAGPVEREASYDQVDYFNQMIAERGFGFWAVEVRETGQFIGFTGLSVPRFEASFLPVPEKGGSVVEIGWRLAKDAWGNGFAIEAARASLAYGFGPAGLDEIVSFTATTNLPSQRVMQRLVGVGRVKALGDQFAGQVLGSCHVA